MLLKGGVVNSVNGQAGDITLGTSTTTFTATDHLVLSAENILGVETGYEIKSTDYYAISTTTFYNIGIATASIRSDLDAEILRSTTTDYNIQVSTSALELSKVNRAGDTMTGDLLLPNLTATYGITAATSTITKSNSPASTIEILWSTNTITANNDFKLIVSSGGIVNVSSITAGTAGDTIELMGTSDTDIVNIIDGGNIKINGVVQMALGLGDIIAFRYYGSYWYEKYRDNN